MKQFKRSAVAVLSAALLGAAGLAATATPANAAQDTAGSASTAQDVTWLNFSSSSWSHWSRDSKDSTHAGILNAGRNYVYCWAEGEVYSGNGHTSGNWLLTDDDSGNTNVWVSGVYLAPDSYGAPLRHC
ncbi:hypothetical protein [Streptomyces laurentii]|uniref:hypothetical protein n=1 Tax=Streptomyces laurentii TaxID=39478 RepID=UPI0036B3F96B